MTTITSPLVMLVMELGCCRLLLLSQLLIHLHKQFHLIGIDPVQIQVSPVRNRTIPVLRGLEKRNKASSFWNYDIPDPDQIGYGDGWSSTCAIESGWKWSWKAKVIRNNQHTPNGLAWVVEWFCFHMDPTAHGVIYLSYTSYRKSCFSS